MWAEKLNELLAAFLCGWSEAMGAAPLIKPFAGYGPEAPLAAGELTSQKNNSFAAFLSLALINQLHTLRPPSEAKTAEKQI